MKKLISWLIASSAVMLALPWLAVTFIKGDGGMTACFILIFALNPIFAITSGISAERIYGRCGRFRSLQRYSFLLEHEQGWTKRLFCDSGDIIPYSISTSDRISNGFQLVLSGDVSVVIEEHLGDWKLLEVTSDCSKLIYPTCDRANYILLFQKTTGYLVLISGELDMETLEHIAYEMEIRESGIPKVEHTGGPLIGTIDLARG